LFKNNVFVNHMSCKLRGISDWK